MGIKNKISMPVEINFYNIEVIDWTPPSIQQCNDFLHILDNTRTDIVFHCESGFGRTGIMMFLITEYKNTILYYNDVNNNIDNLKDYYIIPENILEYNWSTDEERFGGKNPALKYFTLY